MCGSGVGASVCANKIKGMRACLIEDHFSARQGVEDDNLNMICLGGRIEGRSWPGIFFKHFSPPNSAAPSGTGADWPRMAKPPGKSNRITPNRFMNDTIEAWAVRRDIFSGMFLTTLMKLRNRLPCLAVLLCLVALDFSGAGQSAPRKPSQKRKLSSQSGLNTNAIVLPQPLSDPLEPFNRAVWKFNVGLMSWVMKPAARGYRFVAPKPVRTAIGNFGRNLTFPGRFINGLLQGNWKLATTETERCLCNTVFGLGGS